MDLETQAQAILAGLSKINQNPQELSDELLDRARADLLVGALTPEAPNGGIFDKNRERLADLPGMLDSHHRVILAGGPRSGKSTVAVRIGERYGMDIRHADGLIGKFGWSELSAEVATWMDHPGPWVIEGVRTPHALRKWLKNNPGKSLYGITVVWMNQPIQVRRKEQESMAVATETVYAEIVPQLYERGATIINKTTDNGTEWR